jgi:hypothetical protein
VPRRLARLEARRPPAARERFVRLDGGDPVPEPASGERLTVLRWLWAADAATGGDSPTGAAHPVSPIPSQGR